MSRFSLFLFGIPRIEQDALPIQISTRKAIALLAYLAVTAKSHSRDGLAALLWPNFDQTRARAALRRTLPMLRKTLPRDWFEVDRENISLNRNDELWIDVAQFQGYLLECRTHDHTATDLCPDCIDPLTKAVRLYQDDFMAGFSLQDSADFDDWQFSQAQSLNRDLASVLERLLRGYRDQGKYEEAIVYARRWLTLDPLHEPANRRMMELYALSGQRSEALRHYEEYVRNLEEELGALPQDETTQLYEGIKENREIVVDSPLLQSVEVSPNNLPRQLTSFIGREREIIEVKKLLASTYLLTFTGSGGCGKTRLALQVADELVEEYKDGVWLIEFASISDPVLVAQEVALALDVSEQPNRSFEDTLSDYLRSKEMLLILDNCEHLIESSAKLTETLLQSCLKLRILVTSREALGIAGETAWRVPSLSLPEIQSIQSLGASNLNQYEAVNLFLDRATAALPTFRVTDQDASIVAQICHRLDGIPLALELAAVLVKVLSLDQIAKRLEDSFQSLTGGSRTALSRQQTLRATIDWSYDLLSETERVLLNRLAVFAGGWSLMAAEAICTDIEGTSARSDEILVLLTGLTNKSLVVAEKQGNEMRYRLLETVRQYARDRLLESGESEVMRNHHLDWYMGLAEQAEPQLHGPEQVEWMNRLEMDHDNLRAALQWSLGNGNTERGLRLAGALGWFWTRRGYTNEGYEWFEKALSRRIDVAATLRAKVFTVAGDLIGNHGDNKRGAEFAEEGLTLFRQLGDKEGIADSLHNLGHQVYSQGDSERAESLYEESLSLFRELKSKQKIILLIIHLGEGALDQGDYSRAKGMFEEALVLSRELGGKTGITRSLISLGKLAQYRGDHKEAELFLEESLDLCREMGDNVGIVSSFYRLGESALDQGDHSREGSIREKFGFVP